ncbi:hypothetical protein ACFW1A_07855 [Kitasatospora sp. NPDC058965]|uniref:DUF7544 domain-containing protein n=1 Tax=Kitasatospora sp. NPDC058965 TaxID=3346682 RepID=UPI00369E0BC9
MTPPPAAPPYSGSYGVPGGAGAPVPPQRGWNPPPGWGQQQPQWGQPQRGGQPQGGQPQWGQPQWGQQPQWGMRPPSPKPGVIPLRPLAVGEILDGSIATARQHWRTVLPLSLIVAVLSQSAVTTLNWVQLNGSANIAALVGGLAGALISAVAGLVVTALLTIVVSKATIGESVSVGTAWQAARGQLWKLVGLTLMITLIVVGVMAAVIVPCVLVGIAMGGLGSDDSGAGAGAAVLIFFGFMAAIALGAWMYVRLSLAAPALMLERQGVFEAMRRSRRLVRGSWWRIFGINLLGLLLTGILAGVIALPFRLLSGGSGAGGPLAGLVPDPNNPPSLASLVIVAIGGVLGATLTTPIKSGISVLLYVDQRIRREALDLELARAAGLPEYGGSGWAGQQPGQYPPYPGPHGAA